LAFLSCGIKPNDQVILLSFTWFATANAVEYVGEKQIFCDIDINTFNIDVLQVEIKISEKTKAIIPVHLFGLCADMGTIMDITWKYDLIVIEDAACAVGAYFENKHGGSFG